jgi:hypothetical protein
MKKEDIYPGIWTYRPQEGVSHRPLRYWYIGDPVNKEKNKYNAIFVGYGYPSSNKWNWMNLGVTEMDRIEDLKHLEGEIATFFTRDLVRSIFKGKFERVS